MIKKFLKSCCLFTAMLSLSTNLVMTRTNASTLTEREKLNAMSIEELLEYCEQIGLEVNITDYSAIKKTDKNKLIEGIEFLSAIPDTVVLESSEQAESVGYETNNSVSAIENNNLIQPASLTEYILYDQTQTKSYTGHFYDDYYYKIFVTIRYDVFVDRMSNTKSFYEVKSITSRNDQGPITSATYNQLDAWVSRMSSSAVYVSGIGEYKWSGDFGSIGEQFNFTTSYFL